MPYDVASVEVILVSFAVTKPFCAFFALHNCFWVVDPTVSASLWRQLREVVRFYSHRFLGRALRLKVGLSILLASGLIVLALSRSSMFFETEREVLRVILLAIAAHIHDLPILSAIQV
jgi:hypothetical protein